MVIGILVCAAVWGPVVVFVVAVAISDHRRERRRDAEWVRDLRARPSVLSHVAADGEVVEYPIIRGESLVSLATTLGEIAALPEVPA